MKKSLLILAVLIIALIAGSFATSRLYESYSKPAIVLYGLGGPSGRVADVWLHLGDHVSYRTPEIPWKHGVVVSIELGYSFYHIGIQFDGEAAPEQFTDVALEVTWWVDRLKIQNLYRHDLLRFGAEAAQ